MGGFMASPIQPNPTGQPPSASAPAPAQAPPQQGNMDSLIGQQGMMKSPQQAEMEAQAGALDQLRMIEQAFGTLSQLVQQMSSVYPGAAQPAREVMQALEQGRQSLLGFMVPMMSGMPDAQPRGPAFMGG